MAELIAAKTPGNNRNYCINPEASTKLGTISRVSLNNASFHIKIQRLNIRIATRLMCRPPHRAVAQVGERLSVSSTSLDRYPASSQASLKEDSTLPTNDKTDQKRANVTIRLRARQTGQPLTCSTTASASRRLSRRSQEHNGPSRQPRAAQLQVLPWDTGHRPIQGLFERLRSKVSPLPASRPTTTDM